MFKLLANDGIEADAKKTLEAAGIEVITEKVPQEKLMEALPAYDVISVRSATQVRKALIDACPNLKIIARGGVGLDNIDVAYAKERGIAVINTPAASSQSVAELAMAHAYSLSRFVHLANRQMAGGNFNQLKKDYSKGIELKGRTMGIVGFGRIGQALAALALGVGMKVVASDPFIKEATLTLDIADQQLNVNIQTIAFEDLLAQSDVISLHVPSLGKPLVGAAELAQMKRGVVLLNCARGGVIDEIALLEALESGQVAGAGLDTFIGEPTPRTELLTHPRISVTPHIGASTGEAQARIGQELAAKIIAHLKG